MTATLLTFPVFRAFDSNGAPLAGGLLYSYQAGTTTPLATYVDQAGVTQNTNPVVLDSTGTANVWLGDSTYKLVLKDSEGVQQWSVDNIQSEASQISAAIDGVYSSFANTSDISKGDALVGVKKTGGIATTQHAVNESRVYDVVVDFGADPTGATDSTTEIQAAIDTGKSIYFPAGTYKVGTLTVQNKSDVAYFANNDATITNVGATSATDAIFKMVGTLSNILWQGLTIVGDGATDTYNSAIACASGQTGSKLLFKDLKISSVRLGISLNADLSGSFTDCTIDNCFFTDIVGEALGTGYAIHLPNALYTTVNNCTFDNVGRHEIYIPKGGYCKISKCTSRNHRKDTYTGSIRPAIVVATASYVTVSECVFHDYYDSAISFLVGSGAGADNSNNSIVDCVFVNPLNPVPSIAIGAQEEPATERTKNVNILGNRFYSDASIASSHISVVNGQFINIKNNHFTSTNQAGTFIAISVGSDSYSTAQYDCSWVTIVDNQFTVKGTSGTAYLVNLSGYLATSVDRTIWIDTKFSFSDAGITAVSWGSAGSGYANIAVQGAVGRGGRTAICYDSSIPTTGDWIKGDVVYNISPSAGGFIGWVCTTAGSPGTWKEFGTIEA